MPRRSLGPATTTGTASSRTCRDLGQPEQESNPGRRPVSQREKTTTLINLLHLKTCKPKRKKRTSKLAPFVENQEAAKLGTSCPETSEQIKILVPTRLWAIVKRWGDHLRSEGGSISMADLLVLTGYD